MEDPANITRDDVVFAVLAEETLEQIRQDRQDARSLRVRAMLSYIERQLFTQGLTLRSAVKECRIADRSISTVFRRAVGLTPARYIESCRMDIAKQLLRQTQIKATRISELLGYASHATFANAFARLFQDPPRKYRARSVVEALDQGLKPYFEADRVLLLRRAMAGRLSDSEASILITTLSELYPGACCTQPPSHLETVPSDRPFNLPPTF